MKIRLLPGFWVVLAILTVAYALSGCARGGAWAPTTKTLTYHIDGSFPGPRTYGEVDQYLGRYKMDGKTAMVYIQKPDATIALADGKRVHYWDDMYVALLQQRDGTWDKYMSCAEPKAGRVACQNFVERGFMPAALYPGKHWQSRISNGMDAKVPWQVMEHQADAKREADGSLWVTSRDQYTGEMKQVTLVYREQFNHEGILVKQMIYNSPAADAPALVSSFLTREGN